MKKKVILRAPVLSKSGYGEHSRQILRFLLQKNIDLKIAIVPWGITPWYLNHDECDGLIGKAMSISNVKEGEEFDISIQVQLPNEWNQKLAKVNIPAGRPIDSVYDVVSLDTSRMPTDSSGRPDLSAGISESYILDRGERLIAVPVDISSTFTLRETIIEGTREVTKVNTKLLKGDLVDVIATYKTENNVQASVLLAQKVQVHQVEVSEADDFSEGLNVILRTTPDIALDITFMKNVGKIDLILSPVNAIESKTRELNISRVIDRSLAR